MKKTSQDRSKKREAHCLGKSGNVVIPVYRQERTKNGQTYVTYMVSDYADGARSRRTFSVESDAKEYARSRAEKINAGLTEVDFWDDSRKQSALRAFRLAQEAGVDLLVGVEALTSALKLTGSLENLRAAAALWHTNPPTSPTTPKKSTTAVTEYLTRRKDGISAHRHKNLSCFLGLFATRFEDRNLDEITGQDIQDWLESQTWSNKTRKDVLCMVNQLYRDAILRRYVPKVCLPGKEVKIGKVKRRSIEVFTPAQFRKILETVDSSLVPFFALWGLSGMRKEEISKLSWAQVSAGLESGSIYLRAEHTKTNESRSIPICDALREWLLCHLMANGRVLPERWQANDPLMQIRRLDDLTKCVRRKCLISWIANGLRHAFCTYHLKANGDVMLTARIAGTSLAKLQTNYVSRSESITKKVALEWFDVRPQNYGEKVVPLPVAASA